MIIFADDAVCYISLLIKVVCSIFFKEHSIQTLFHILELNTEYQYQQNDLLSLENSIKNNSKSGIKLHECGKFRCNIYFCQFGKTEMFNFISDAENHNSAIQNSFFL